MTTDSPADRRSHELVRYAYVEQLLVNRRVLVVGAVTRATCEHLAERGARTVVGVTDDEDALDALVAEPSPRNVSYQAMSFGALNFRDGAFDVVIVPDLAALPDPEPILREARRVLTPEGAAVISLANRDALGGLASIEPPDLGYTELFEICSNVWSLVRMAGQSPFVGYAVADFAPEDEEPSISFDASLAPDEGEEVEFYVAVCSDEPVEIDPYAIVQMPLADVVPQELDARGAEDDAELLEAIEREKERAVEHNIRAQRLEHELKAMAEEAAKGRDRAARFARELEEEKKARQRAEIEGQMARRSPEIAELRERIAALQGELDAARAAVQQVGEQANRAQAEAWQKEHDRLDGEIRHLRDGLEGAERARLEAEAHAKRVESVAAERERELQGHRTVVAERDARLAALAADLETRPRPEQLEALTGKVRSLEEQVSLLRAAVDEGDADRGRDLGRLEDELRQRSRRVSELEAEVTRREAIVRDLCSQLEDSSEALPEMAEAARERQVELDTAQSAAETAVQRAEQAEGRLALELGRAAERDAKIAALQDERQACQWRIDELEARLVAASQGLIEVDVAAAMTRGYRMRIAELEDEIAQSGGAPEASRTALDDLRARLAEVQQQLAECRARSAELESALQDCKSRGQVADEALQGSRATAGRLEAYAREVEGEIAAARTRIAELDQALTTAQMERDEHAGRFQASETDASFARHMATIAQEEVLELRSILTIREAQLAAIEGARRGFEARARELELGDGDRKTLEVDLTGRLSALQTELEAMHARVLAAAEAAQEAMARAQSAEARESEGAAAVRRLMDEGDAQRVRLREALERGDVLLAELQARQSDVVDVRREREKVEEAASDLRRRLEESEAQREAARAEAEGVVRVRQDLEFRVEARERELAEVRAAHAALEGDFRNARGMAEARAQELTELRRTSADALAEMRGLVETSRRESEEARRSSSDAGHEIERLREQNRALETSAEEMAARASAAIADAEERSAASRQSLEAQTERLRRDLSDALRRAEAPDVDAMRADLARAKDELGRKVEELTSNEVLLRSLMAQMEEREGRIALLERRSHEDGQRTDSTMRGYDERMHQMSEELMQLRSEHSDRQHELEAVRRELLRIAEDPRSTPLLDEIRALLRRLRS